MVQNHDGSSAVTDTVTFRIATGKSWLCPWAKVLVLVDVVERIDPPETHDGLFERVSNRLRGFIDVEWSMEGFHRGLDAAGVPRASFVASASVKYDDMYGLDERARRASSNGFSILGPIVEPTYRTQWTSHNPLTIEEQLLEQITDRVRRLSRLTRRKWRIGDVRFAYSWSSSRMELEPKCKVRIANNPEHRGPRVEMESLQLIAHVVLKSNAPGFRSPRLPDPPVTAAHEEWEWHRSLLRGLEMERPSRPAVGSS